MPTQHALTVPAGRPDPFTVTFPAAAHAEWKFSCKEMFDVTGFPATCGHPRFAAWRGERDTSRVVRRFQAAGATLFGKTRQSELAVSGLGENPHVAPPLNAIDPQRAVGGSSSGCAVAVATKQVDFSLATDSAGSARIPAACNGVIGYSMAGASEWLSNAVRLSYTLDQLGVIVRDSASLERALRVLGMQQSSYAPPAIQVPQELVEARCTAEVQHAFAVFCKALARWGIKVLSTESVQFDAVDRLQSDHGSLVLAEMAASLEGFLKFHSAEVSPSIIKRLAPYSGWADDRIATLHHLVMTPLRAYRALYPLPILLPTLPCVTPQLGDSVALGMLTKFGNLLGENAVSVPIPGMGQSVMLISREPPLLLGFAEILSYMRA